METRKKYNLLAMVISIWIDEFVVMNGNEAEFEFYGQTVKASQHPNGDMIQFEYDGNVIVCNRSAIASVCWLIRKSF